MSTNSDAAASPAAVIPNDAQPNHHQAELDKRRVGQTTSSQLQLQNHLQLIKKSKTALLSSISKLKTQISETESQLQEVNSKLRSPENASQTVRNHIHLLHAYNEIRDVGQGLLGLVADARGVRHVDIQKEFGVAAGD